MCSKCHPYFTGKQKLVDTGGRVAKFNKKFGLDKKNCERGLRKQTSFSFTFFVPLRILKERNAEKVIPMEENKLNTVEQPRDRVVLVGLSSPVLKADSADEESMDELAALVETAGAVSVATVLQNLPSPNPRSFIGEGKVAEIKELIGSTEATMAIFDNDLSPSQMRVLTEDLGVQVLDRSGLILIFLPSVPKTKEGRLQVELAQYQYLLPRLIGMWTHLERQAAQAAGAHRLQRPR